MTAGPPARWVLATGNAGKAREFRELLGKAPIELTPLADIGLTSPEESAPTFIENALLKARNAARLSGLPAIADDSGLVVPALGGHPGIRSARFAGLHATDAENIQKLLSALAPFADTQRNAAFVCVVVALRAADDPDPVVVHGRWEGAIAASPRGLGGFGYDPVFVDPASGLTAAELTAEEKNARSHRGLAVAALASAMRRPGPAR